MRPYRDAWKAVGHPSNGKVYLRALVYDEIVEEGQRAAARMRFAGIHRGQFFGVAPSGREIAWSRAAFFAINDDKITSLWVLGDIDSIKQQLGIHGPAVPKGRFTS